eukprot:scaffold3005_cov63-Phaeocystis_antarctica.AAC.1
MCAPSLPLLLQAGATREAHGLMLARMLSRQGQTRIGQSAPGRAGAHLLILDLVDAHEGREQEVDEELGGELARLDAHGEVQHPVLAQPQAGLVRLLEGAERHAHEGEAVLRLQIARHVERGERGRRVGDLASQVVRGHQQGELRGIEARPQPQPLVLLVGAELEVAESLAEQRGVEHDARGAPLLCDREDLLRVERAQIALGHRASLHQREPELRAGGVVADAQRVLVFAAQYAEALHQGAEVDPKPKALRACLVAQPPLSEERPG